MRGESDLLFGRRTYEDFYRSWAVAPTTRSRRA